MKFVRIQIKIRFRKVLPFYLVFPLPDARFRQSFIILGAAAEGMLQTKETRASEM